MAHRITRIAGDGIGPEVTAATCRVLEAAGVEIEWEDAAAGENAIRSHGTPLPDATLESIRRNRVALKGPTMTPIGGGHRSVNVGIRQALNTYACLRPISGIPGVECHFPDLDIVILRENTEGLYSGLEHEVVPGVVESLKVATRVACMRISEFGFAYAKRRGRRKITAVHKANIMKMSDGLFLECARAVAAENREIRYEELIVDNTALQLVRNPDQFDLLLLENLYGDILSDLAAGLIGGLGVTPGANFGDEVAVFEAVHGAAPDIAGRNLANPTALLRSAILMLEHIGEEEAARRVDQALRAVFAKGEVRTGDLGGKATTPQFTGAICAELARLPTSA